MPYASLRDFIQHLEQNDRLVRVKEPVSTVLEMTEIQTRLLAEGGPAVLFENPVDAKGNVGDIPVLVTCWHRRTGRLGYGPRTRPIAGGGETRLPEQPEPPGGFKGRSACYLGENRAGHETQTIGSAPIHDIVPQGTIDLDKLPIQSCWPGEPAPLITWPLVVTQGPNPGDKTDAFNPASIGCR